VSHRLLPPAPDRGLWADVFGEVFRRPSDPQWVSAVPRATWCRLFGAIVEASAGDSGADEPDGLDRLRQETLQSLVMLAHRVAALGVEPALTRYTADPAERESPFLGAAAELLAWCDLARTQRSIAGFAADRLAHVGVLLDQCDAVLRRIRRLAHEQGTSIGLTTLVLRAGSTIGRVRVLLAALAGSDLDARVAAGVQLLFALVDGHARANGVREFYRSTTELLALQVTENASRTGEHYVSSSREEYWAMARSAAGAGVIVGFMALVKILLAKLHLPPFWEAFAFGLNYAVGFVLVHLLHFTIATKQPAMTAATIAAAVDDAPDRQGALARVAELTERITRTQTIAIVGNVALAFPVSLLIALAWQALFGEPPAGPEKAAHLLHDSHPLRSYALPHAAIAGVCLFMAGIVSGYYDNRCVYAQIPQRIRGLRRLVRLLGEERVDRLAGYVENNLGAIAGNVAFGFMLGFVGFFGVILGLPLDIRHVTFSGANEAYGLAGLRFDVSLREILATTAGVALIGLTNLGVSFSLALWTAMSSRGLRLRLSGAFVGTLAARLRANPMAFLLPPPRGARAGDSRP
jgi:site-specific recombinase